MLFENKTSERIKFPIARHGGIADWVTVRPGEKKEFSEEDSSYAEAHGLTLVEVKAKKSSIGKKKVETKKIEEPEPEED